MTDPYQVLGIPPDSSEEEIKTAYRELARKYHPDSYQDNPLSDLAGEKMKEINEAYDLIMAQRRGGGQDNYGPAQHESHTASQFADIRRLFNARRITEAEELLDGVPRPMRDGEWHFLKGSVQYTRGWLDDAYENFVAACNLAPGNTEYRTALNQLQWQRQTGRASGYRGAPQPPGIGCSVCDVCATMYCASCCCDCMRCY